MNQIRNIRRLGCNTVIIHGDDAKKEIKQMMKDGRVTVEHRPAISSSIVAELFEYPAYDLAKDRCALSVRACATMAEARKWATENLKDLSS